MKRLLIVLALLMPLPAFAANWNNGAENQTFANIAASTGGFQLLGGNYGVTVHTTTWNSATVTLQRLAADGSTYVTVMTAFSADGYATANLPAGTYRFTVSGSPTSINIDVTAVVTVKQ
jgi:hypothetical protein